MSIMSGLSRREREARAEDGLLGQVGKTRSRIMKAIATERHDVVPLRAIAPNPKQPRKLFDQAALEELASTIRLHGLQQSILLEQTDEDEERFLLIAGERRWRAFQWLAAQPSTPDFDPADFERIPALIRYLRSSTPDRTRAILALIENVVREDLSPRERATAFSDLKSETGWSWDAVARHLGMDPGRVKKLASLDGQDVVLDALERGEVTQNQAFALARLRDPDLAAQVVPAMTGATEEATAAVVRRVRELDDVESGEARVAQAVTEVLGTPVVGRRGAIRQASYPLRVGSDSATISVDLVALTETPLRQLRPRLREVERETLAGILQATCAQLDIWPTRPASEATSES